MHQLRLAVLLLVLLTAIIFAYPVSAQNYTITYLGDLSAPPFDGESKAHTINDAGQVVGEAAVYYEEPHNNGFLATTRQGAFLWQNGMMGYLGTMGGAGNPSFAYGINALGNVVGAVENYDTKRDRAFVWKPNEGLTLLPTPGFRSSAHSINDRGEIVGDFQEETDRDAGRAFIYRNGALQVLAVRGGALDINALSHVVGFGDPLASSGWPTGWFFLDDNGLHFSSSSGRANSLNDKDEVVGWNRFPSGDHAFLYKDGVTRDLGLLYKREGLSSWANGINNAGWIVGDSMMPDGSTHAFLYHDGRMIDLNTLIPPASGWELLTANAINNAGQIVGQGKRAGYTFWRGFLLTPK